MKQDEKFIKKSAEIMRSLGHPARMDILILLMNNERKKMSVTQIHEQLGLTQPETSRHLSILKNSSVLCCEREKSNSFYFINWEDSFICSLSNCIGEDVKENNSDREASRSKTKIGKWKKLN